VAWFRIKEPSPQRFPEPKVEQMLNPSSAAEIPFVK
jgi:hypothetical protein